MTRGSDPSLKLGANLVTLAGLGFIGFGIMFLIRNFSDFIEIGLTAEHVGATPEQIRAVSPQLFNYISHLHVGLGGLGIAIGVAVVALARYGIRDGQSWALWTAVLVPVTAIVLSVPIHYAYGIATLGHLGLVYLNTAILMVGSFLAWRGLRS